jgi:hypothetical protein
MTRERGSLLLLCAFARGLCATHGGAQTKTDAGGSSGYYSCRDAQGRLLTSDRPIMECLDREQKVHNNAGTVRRVIEAPLTPEQRRARDEAHKREQAERERAEQARRHDQILLSSYSSVAAIETAQARARAEPQSGIAKSQARLEQLAKERAALDAEKDFYKGRALPGDLERKLQDNDRARRYELDLIARRNEELRQIDERFEADKKRFIELNAAQQAGAR